jgi:hypothetical protein
VVEAGAGGGAAADAARLHTLLVVLENATFTCQSNGDALVRLVTQRSSSGSGGQSGGGGGGALPSGGGQQFPALLVDVARQLLLGLASPRASEALHVALSVLMNLSHQNPEGARVIAAAGGLAIGADILDTLLGPSRMCHQELCAKVRVEHGRGVGAHGLGPYATQSHGAACICMHVLPPLLDPSWGGGGRLCCDDRSGRYDGQSELFAPTALPALSLQICVFCAP